MRILLSSAATAAAIGFLCLPGLASTNYLTKFGVGENEYLNCKTLTAQGAYAKAIPYCAASAVKFAAGGAATKNWQPYSSQASALQLEAIDESRLGHHHTALQTALHAHRLVLYVWSSFGKLDSDDYAALGETASELKAFEINEESYIRRGLGD